jgi:uncharacterized membrane protein
MAYAAGAVICHQRPERSFHLAGAKLPVCARCVSLYTGGAIGLLAWTLIRRRRREPVDSTRALLVIAMAGAPTLLSVTSGVIGLWDGTNVTRAVLSLPLGLAAGALTAAVAARDLR